MRKTTFIASLLLALMLPMASPAADGWKNPVVLPGQSAYDVGDPQVMKYRGVYYLYCSSGTNSLLCWSSRDLINWSDATVVCNDPTAVAGYAPEVKYWNGKFYMVTSPDGNGHYVLTSDSPTGPFKVVTDNLGRFIDGSIFIDDDGEWYFYHAEGSGIKGNRMPTHTSFGTDTDLNACMAGHWTEGPGVFKRNGKYYLIYTGNHVLTPGYRIDYAVSTQGPISRYTPQAEQNPILINADGVDGHLGLGHGSAFIGPDLDSYYFCYHNMTRPGGGYTRQLDIDRMAWNGDKLMMLGGTTWMQDKPIVAPNDYFDRDLLGDNWTVTGGTWAIEGRDHLAQTAAGGDAMAVLTPYAYDSFTAEFNVRQREGSEQGTIGAVFAYTDEANYSEAVLNTATSELELYTVSGGTRSKVTTSKLVGDFDPHFWHCIRLEKNGTRLKVFVDGLLRSTTVCAAGGGKAGYVSHATGADFSYIAISPYVDGSGILDVNLPVPGILPAALCKTQSTGVRREQMTLSYGQCEVMGLGAGGWIELNINSRLKYTYNMGLRYKSSAPARVRLLAGGSVVKDDIVLPSTGGVWMVAPINDFQLPARNTTLRVECVEGDVSLYELLIKRGTSTPKTYADDFESGKSSIWKHTEGVWTVTDGWLKSPAYGKIVAGTLTDLGMTDYTVECDINCSGTPNAGLMFRTNNPSIGGANDDTQLGTDFQQGYFLGINPTALVLGKQNYGWQTLVSRNRTFYTSQTYHLKVEVQGATIKAYVNNETKPSITYTDPLPFISGRTGLRSHNCVALFDNFKVTPLGTTTGIEGITADRPDGSAQLMQPFTAYTISGVKVASAYGMQALYDLLPKGAYVVRGADGYVMKMMKK